MFIGNEKVNRAVEGLPLDFSAYLESLTPFPTLYDFDTSSWGPRMLKAKQCDHGVKVWEVPVVCD